MPEDLYKEITSKLGGVSGYTLTVDKKEQEYNERDYTWIGYDYIFTLTSGKDEKYILPIIISITTYFNDHYKTLSVNIEMYLGMDYEVDVYNDEFEGFEGFESFIHNQLLGEIDNALNENKKWIKERKSEDEFYKKITVDEIRDLLSDLSDEIGEFDIRRHHINSRVRGFVANCNIKCDFLIPDDGDVRIIPNDSYAKFSNEICSLYKRMKDGYNLSLLVKFSSMYDNDGDATNESNLMLLINEIS